MPEFQFLPAGSPRISPPRVLILGEPKSGKTRLAATFPDPIFIDVESDGAASALPVPPPRMVVPITANTTNNVVTILGKISKAEYKDGAYMMSGETPVRTVIVDPFDYIQRAEQSFNILRGNKVKMSWEDWGVLLERMYPMVVAWSGLKCNVVVVGHTKVISRDDKPYDEAGLAVRGALKDELPGWFSVILHVVAEENGKRYVIKDKTTRNRVRMLAGDRHNVLKDLARRGDVIDITSETGWPDTKIARAICGESYERQNEADGSTDQGE